MDIKLIHDNIIKGIKGYFNRNGLKNAVIGLSGGIDSAVTLVMVKKAIGSKNITALLMPDIGISSIENYKHAKQIALKNKVKYFIVPINNLLRNFSNLPWKISKFADMNVKARIRANILYHYANSYNALVIGTSNKTELLLGYFTKYGDGAVDIEVIGELYKTEVLELARYIGISDEIISKPPAAELYIGHTDEKELGGSYKDIDNILINMLIGKKQKGKLANKIIRLVKQNRHKTLPIPLIKKS